jgi:hypothetical protein
MRGRSSFRKTSTIQHHLRPSSLQRVYALLVSAGLWTPRWRKLLMANYSVLYLTTESTDLQEFSPRLEGLLGELERRIIGEIESSTG